MRAMSGSNYSEFVKGYYPVFNRKGLVIDMRQNYGGNIDCRVFRLASVGGEVEVHATSDEAGAVNGAAPLASMDRS